MDPATIAALTAAGVELIQQIVQMIESAKTASTEEHATIAANFAAAQLALKSAADAAHASLAADIAADAAALAVK